jgi:iron complex outermembrane receptor protein
MSTAYGRFVWCSAALLLGLPAPALAQTHIFNIPSQDAATAIVAFGLQAGVQITAPVSQLEGMKTPAVRGALDARAALGALLQGTRLAVARDDGRTITLTIEPRSAAIATMPVLNVSELLVTGTRVRAAEPQPSAEVSSRDERSLAYTGKTNVSR